MVGKDGLRRSVTNDGDGGVGKLVVLSLPLGCGARAWMMGRSIKSTNRHCD